MKIGILEPEWLASPRIEVIRLGHEVKMGGRASTNVSEKGKSNKSPEASTRY